MEIAEYYQNQAKIILTRNARKLDRSGGSQTDWDRWLSTVLFAWELHVIDAGTYKACLRRYADRLDADGQT